MRNPGLQRSAVAAGPAAPTVVTAASLEAASDGLPFILRRAFGYAVAIAHGSLEVGLPDGRRFRFEGDANGPEAVIEVRDLGFARRLITGGDIGLAEAYLRGEWDSPDVTAFLELFCVNHAAVKTLLPGVALMKLWQKLRHWLRRNTKAGSRRNIHAHYDLGNRFYAAWLDRTMTYSAAIFVPGDNDLSAAQTRKYRLLAEATGIRPEHHVLEIGCGWGGFAEFAARDIGCRVTALTISREQYEFAVRRIAEAGLTDRVTIKLQDYRDETGSYDRIASIEMFEAVGEAYWPAYFGQLRDRLKPGGAAGLQIITIQDRFFPVYRSEIDFIRRYIFPGGMLPCPAQLETLAGRFGLGLHAERIFGLDYAATLQHWRDAFRASWPELRPHGFDERFRRLWEYYLSYCEAGFRAGTIDVRQLVYVKAG